MDCYDSGQGQVAACCERGNEHSGFHKMGEFFKSEDLFAS
jgi:hypothetical protein